MDINQAAEQIERFLDQYRQQNPAWQPVEIRVLPSGDEMDAIKIWLNFAAGTSDDDVERLRDAALEALRTAHPDLEQAYRLHIRADAE